jgi:DNA-binding GntR family transcriptional regulator
LRLDPNSRIRSYLHPRLGLTQDSDFRQRLHDLIQVEFSLVADQSFEEFTAVPADTQLAHWLAVPKGTALLRRERRVLDTGRRPIEFSVVHYRCNRFRLTLSLLQE